MDSAPSPRAVTSALVVAEITIFLGPAALRVPAGLALGLVLPGLVLSPLLAGAGLARSERTLLVPGLSLAVAIVVGVLLNAAGITFTVESWAGALGLVTTAGLLITQGRRGTRPGRAHRRVHSKRPGLGRTGSQAISPSPRSPRGSTILGIALVNAAVDRLRKAPWR